MKNAVLFWCAAGMLMVPSLAFSATDGQIRVRQDGTNTLLQVQGDQDDEWRFQFSGDLDTWTNLTVIGAVFASRSNAATVTVTAESPVAAQGFYRAVKTDGLYDIAVLRTLSLTFTQANWQTLLTSGRTTGSNTLGDLVVDNGMAYTGIGARYRGNTSFSGMGQGGAPIKKSVNIELDYTDTTADLMGYNTLNLNNSYGDETLMREALYFYVMHNYTVCPQGSLARLYINGQYWGVYSFAQQENGDLIRQWCPSYDGDLWRAPNMAGMGGTGPGGGRPGGGEGSGASALSYLGANLATYQSNYELKTDHSTNAWPLLMNAIDVLNNTPTDQLRDKVEDVLAVDRWLWFLAIENLFADDDSYFNKGADYGFYYEPESGRIHPVEHDGNESFMAGDVSLSPVQGAGNTSRPVLNRLLGVTELRQRYLAHMRTVMQEYYNPTAMNALIQQFSALSYNAIVADPKKGFTMTAYASDVTALKAFIANRYKYLTNHAELRPVPPVIGSVHGPGAAPTALEIPVITAEVLAGATETVDSVWLYYRNKSYGRFTMVQMLDDGVHGDGLAGDGVFGASTAPFPAGTKVRYYVEARSANSAKAACFSPARAEEDTYNYRVGLVAAASTPVIINEFMAFNESTISDPQGEYDDWVELRNITDHDVELSGRHLTDDPDNPCKWPFPEGTVLPAGGYLLVWADEDGSATPGLHASFKLSANGEQILLIDTDANANLILDSIGFGPQENDHSYGRSAGSADSWEIQTPTPGEPNEVR